MYKIKETIVVEGVYDKIKLSRFIDGVIMTTNGFGVFRDSRILKSIRSMAEKTGIVILTDSDSAGFKIRNYIKQAMPEGSVKHAYIPDVYGKEKRKSEAGKEGLLGVEGIDDNIILEALRTSGCTIDGEAAAPKEGRKITKADLYKKGLSGGEGSGALRAALAKELGIPMKISANMMLNILNRLLCYEEFCEIVQTIRDRIGEN